MEMLRNPHYQSRVAKGSWEIALEVVDLCGLSGAYELQWRLCKSILESICHEDIQRIRDDSEFAFGGRGDDWSIWIRLVTACAELSERSAIHR